MRSHALLLLVLAAAAAGRAETYDIGADFAKSEGWTRAGAAFVAEHRDSGFRFLEKGREDAGHECKHMPLDDAWAISKAVLFIKPNRK